MGRPRRHLEAGAFYHVGTNGNNRAPIVLDAADRTVFLHILGRVQRRYGWRLHAQCLLGISTSSSSRRRSRTSRTACAT